MTNPAVARFDQDPDVLLAYAREVKGIVESSDDQELVRRIDELRGSIAGLLTFLADGVALAFVPERAQGEVGLVQMVVDTPDGEREVWMRISPDRCQAEAAGGEPDTVLRMSLATFVRIAFKDLTGADAYLEGLIEASGDVVLATTMDDWFDSPDLTVVANS